MLPEDVERKPKFQVGQQVLFDQPHIGDFAGIPRKKSWVLTRIAEVSWYPQHQKEPSYKVETEDGEPSWVFFPESMFECP